MIFTLVFGIVNAAGDEFAVAKKLMEPKTPCNQLSDSQLEIIGDYYMELMHPGQAHQTMEQMMGGEGSESLQLMHIAMAKRLYCNNRTAVSDDELIYGYNQRGTMNMMGNNFGYGMMGNYGYGYLGFLNILGVILLIGLIILVYMWIIKLWKEIRKKGK